jgi:minor extracellular serine protease Vpr
MKHIILLILVIFSNYLFGAPNYDNLISKKYSAHLNAYLSNLDNDLFQKLQDENVIPVFIYGNSNRLSDFLSERFASFTKITDNITTATINLKLLKEIEKLDYIDNVILSSPGEVNDDNQKMQMGVDKVHNGNSGVYPYKGKGVIVAVLDTGIDFYHKEFRDKNDTNKSRILYIWNHSSNKGPMPKEFKYGSEWTKNDIEKVLAKTPGAVIDEDDKDRGHGTHVTGIAAGNSGIAPEADIIMVKLGMAYSTDLERTAFELKLVDAIKYVFNKADELKMPCVINTSLGIFHHIRDGSEPLGKVIDELLNEKSGRAFVASAGNNGMEKMHIGKTLINGDSIDIPFVSFYDAPNITAIPNENLKDLYFSVAIDSGSINLGQTKWLRAQDILDKSAIKDSVFYGLKKVLKGYFTFALSKQSDKFSYMTIMKKTINSNNTPKLKIKGIGSFHTWDYFSSGKYNDVFYNIGSPSSGKNVVSVASSQARHTWKTNTGKVVIDSGYGKQGDISKFSSFGPAIDGRNKPDVTAPGGNVISSKAMGYSPSSNSIWEDSNYMINSGTSMSSPAVAGLVALMLQQYPDYTAEEICEILRSTSIKQYKSVVSWPDLQLGWGFVNAGDVFKTIRLEKIDLFPNPASDFIYLNYTKGINDQNIPRIFNLIGEEIIPISYEKSGVSQYKINLSGFAKGLYFININEKSFIFMKGT